MYRITMLAVALCAVVSSICEPISEPVFVKKSFEERVNEFCYNRTGFDWLLTHEDRQVIDLHRKIEALTAQGLPIQATTEEKVAALKAQEARNAHWMPKKKTGLAVVGVVALCLVVFSLTKGGGGLNQSDIGKPDEFNNPTEQLNKESEISLTENNNIPSGEHDGTEVLN